MKKVTILLIVIFAIIGLLSTGSLIAAWLLPSFTFTTEKYTCSPLVLSSQVSPGGRQVAEHVKLTCDDGLLQHTLYVGPTSVNVDRREEGIILYSNKIEELAEYSSEIYPLRLWWQSDNELVVQHHKGVHLRSTRIDGVKINSQLIPSSPNNSSNLTGAENAPSS